MYFDSYSFSTSSLGTVLYSQLSVYVCFCILHVLLNWYWSIMNQNRMNIYSRHYPALLVRLCGCFLQLVEYVEPLLLIQVFKPRTPPEAISLCSRLLEYTPASRFSPLEACSHVFFDELRQPNTRLPSGRELPMLFNFSSTGMNVHIQ